MKKIEQIKLNVLRMIVAKNIKPTLPKIEHAKEFKKFVEKHS